MRTFVAISPRGRIILPTRFFGLLSFLAIAALFTACSKEEPLVTTEPEISKIEALADEFLAATLERNPTLGTYYAIEGARHDRLYDNSLDDDQDENNNDIRHPVVRPHPATGAPVLYPPKDKWDAECGE